MWETLAIIVTLGGLELTLWLLDRCTIRQDHEMCHCRVILSITDEMSLFERLCDFNS